MLAPRAEATAGGAVDDGSSADREPGAKRHLNLDASSAIDIGDIAELANDHAELLPSLPNLQLIGGCCGTDHRHIAAICSRCLS